MVPDSVTLPKELAEEREHLVACYLEATDFAAGVLRYWPVHHVKEVVHRGFMRLTTTQRWDKAKGPLRNWFLLLVRNEISELFRTRDRVVDIEIVPTYRHDLIAETGFDRTSPADALLIEREDVEKREREAPLRR